jgi:hypothetical protein
MTRPFRELADATGTPESRRIANERTLDLLADEIERMQNDSYARNDEKHDVVNTIRLTDAEREAIFFFAAIDSNDPALGGYAATLRKLLERLK